MLCVFLTSHCTMFYCFPKQFCSSLGHKQDSKFIWCIQQKKTFQWYSTTYIGLIVKEIKKFIVKKNVETRKIAQIRHKLKLKWTQIINYKKNLNYIVLKVKLENLITITQKMDPTIYLIKHIYFLHLSIYVDTLLIKYILILN